MSTATTQWAPWFEALKVRERQAYDAAAIPAANDMRWRFSNKAARDDFPAIFDLPAAPEDSLLAEARARGKIVRKPLAQLTFLNGHLAEYTPLPEAWIAKGVHFLPLSQAIEKTPALVAPLLFQSAHTLGSSRQVHWHRSGAIDGVFLHVPKGVQLDGDLVVVHFTHGKGAVLRAHDLFLVEENASARLVETGFSLDEAPAFVDAETEIFIGQNAALTRRNIQFFNTQTRCARRESALLSKDARLKALSLLLGAAVDRHESAVRLAGEGAHANVFSIAAAMAGQCFDQRTFQDHRAPNTTSDLLYKNGIFADAKTVFAGMIDVQPGAHGTQAYQSNRNLLMDASAQAYSMPGLEIGDNEVKCSHGATNGPVDEEALFYMRCRGIPEKQARAMLLEGFLAETIDRAEEPSLKDLLLGSLTAKLHSTPHVGQ